MTGEHSQTLRLLVYEARDVIEGLRRLSRLHRGPIPEDIARQLEQTRVDLGTLTTELQDVERAAWEARHPRIDVGMDVKGGGAC
jgi:hypothetical protein